MVVIATRQSRDISKKGRVWRFPSVPKTKYANPRMPVWAIMIECIWFRRCSNVQQVSLAHTWAHRGGAARHYGMSERQRVRVWCWVMWRWPPSGDGQRRAALTPADPVCHWTPAPDRRPGVWASGPAAAQTLRCPETGHCLGCADWPSPPGPPEPCPAETDCRSPDTSLRSTESRLAWIRSERTNWFTWRNYDFSNKKIY